MTMFKKHRIPFQILLLILSFLTLSGSAQPASRRLKVLPKIHLCAEEWEIYQKINEYRIEKGLSAVSLSGSLTYVAQTHVWDLAENSAASGRCNLHSWSDKGTWSSCCYTGDHKRAECMWNKARELTNYPAVAYEIAYWTDEPLDPEKFAVKALLKWKESQDHNAVIINSREWRQLDWKAMGVGFYKGYMVVWFGAEPDEDTGIHMVEK
jgi:uncharacterized protein YkwD